MPRSARFVVVNVVHHVVARGCARTRIFCSDAERREYLTRFSRVAGEEKVLVHGYCLMPNHVHFILTPTTPSGLARLFQRVHTWWAIVFNLRHNRTGHLFQNRYYSSPLSEDHYWAALRYVELNPKRANMVKEPQQFPFSSARAHSLEAEHSPIPLQPVLTRQQFTPQEWRLYLREDDLDVAIALRRALAGSRPVGNPDWLTEQETIHDRALRWRPRGRPRQASRTQFASR
jgi:putative transposase